MFNLADYETVETRLEKWHGQYPESRIETEIIEASNTRFIIVCRLFKTEADAKPCSSGHASETISDRGVNSTSALENCETSAIGRALANAGFAAKGKRASKEEMTKVVKAVAPPIEKDYWTTPFGEQEESIKQVPAPVTIDAAVNTVAEILGTAKDVPSCKHGDMEFKDGVKNGRAWGGYFCRHMGVGGSDPKCPTLWYQLSSQGTWEKQKARS